MFIYDVDILGNTPKRRNVLLACMPLTISRRTNKKQLEKEGTNDLLYIEQTPPQKKKLNKVEKRSRNMNC